MTEFNEILLKNFFAAPLPFRIDGNFGAAAGIAETLVQSQNETIKLLPALPGAWKDGSVRGLRARGDFVIDIKWKSGKLIEGKLRSKSGGTCRIIYGNKILNLKAKAGKNYRQDGKMFG